MKINYMLAAWSGDGWGRNPQNLFVKQHIEKLNTISHDLAQVSVGYPHNPEETKEYTDYIQSLKALDDGTPIVVFPMENNGRSYGQYSRMFDACREFTHYIFIEDDYVPCLDGFDVKLANMFEGIENCGLLCSLFTNNHAAISNGITSHEVLNNMWDKYGILYLLQEGKYEHMSQKEWSYMFMNAGYEIHDWIHEYRSLYHQHRTRPRSYSDGVHHKDIIIPIQFWGRPDCNPIEYIKKEKMKLRG